MIRRRSLFQTLAGLLVTGTALLQAQTVPTGIQEYFILGHEQHVWNMMSKVEAGQGGGAFDDAMNSLVTAVASADNQVIYYDHWEDGLEANVLIPVQASTLVLGDGNVANGDACDFNTDPCGVDLLGQGDFVNFASDAGIAAGCTIPSASPLVFTELCSSVPLNPRCATPGACTDAEIRFDGGDFLETTGGPLSLVHSQDPLTQFIGGSTEVISQQAVEAARSYSVPIGEDLYPAFGCPNCVMEPFHYVDLDLVAFEDGTQVFVDSPGAGTASFTLNRGQHWTSLGFIDDGAFTASLFLTINSGTKVSTSAPIAGMMFTGGDGTWATRHYTLLPDILHSTDYVITAPGDNPAVIGSTPNRPLNIYIFNPDPLNPVTVTTTDTVGATNVVVPPNSVVDYFSGTGRFVPNGSTVRLTSNRNFWGISAHDYDTNISDWGHSWLATKFLTPNYTVSYAPGTLNPPVDQVNLSAIFVAATANNTWVQIDFDNDGVFDVIDSDGDGVPDAAPLPNNTYLVQSLQSLKVFDPNDWDNTGTRIVANKPVAVSYGQDTDLTDYGDTALDTGFTVYPTDQLFLRNVLLLDKSVANPLISTAGGIANYTVTIQTFGFFPITNLLAWDLLPPGVTGADYVPGSTLITYPDLTQGVNDPVPSIDPSTGRDRLDWTLSPDNMGTTQTLTIQYSVTIPAAPGGTPRVLTNEAHSQGNLGGSVFSPTDTAAVIQTDLTLTKSVADDGTPEAGDTLTYTLTVANNGLAAETNAFLTDAIPPNTTFLPGSITNSGPFVGAYSGSQNAVVWSAANFPIGGPHVLTFQVVINPGTPAGTTIANQGTFETTQTPVFPSNEVETVTLGPALVVSKTGPALLHPNEIGTFEIQVQNVGTGQANNILIRDLFPNNSSYVSESMTWRTNVNPFVTVSDAADADEGTEFVDRLELLVSSLGAGEDLAFRFQVLVDPGTGGLFVNNQATISSTEQVPVDTNLVQVPILGDANISGHVFLDLDGNGVQNGSEPDLANMDVVVTDFQGNIQTVSTDANGDYLVTVEPGLATVDVDETDPNFPSGAVLTTANDPQGVTAVSGVTTAATPVGYDPPSLTFTKSSDAPLGLLVPGDTVTYTLQVENVSGIDQTGVIVTDPLPTGTLAVPGSTSVTVDVPVFRSTEYTIGINGGDPNFSGTTLDLTLNQALATDYFVIVQGSDGDGSGGNNRGPDENYAALTQDPFGSGELSASAGASVIRIERGNAVDSWVGVVTVVECLVDCATNGFSLLDVRRVDHTGTTTSGAEASAASWADLNQVLLMGGFNGSGCDTAEAAEANTKVCHVRLFPSGIDQVNWTRDAGGATLSTATSTVMVVEWGSAWTVQRQRVQGPNGGDGANATGEYNTAAISSVARDNTWVWGTGHTDDNGIGDGGEGVLVTLGDGVNQNPNESLLAVGTEAGGTAIDFEAYAITHPDLAVDYRFKADGDGGLITIDVPVDSASGNRFAWVTNGLNGTGTAYPRPMFSAHYSSDTNARLVRRRSGQDFPAWVQGVDLQAVVGSNVFVGGDPSNLVVIGDGVSLANTATMTVTFQLQVDPNTVVTQITNIATLDTDQETPLQASVTDDVIRPGVTVEPNNGNFVVFDAVNPQTRTYSHVITNTGDTDDSYLVTALSEQGLANPGAGWIVELIDPGTGAVLATDTDFTDTAWDGGTVHTGTLIPGESLAWDLRITVPAGTPEDTEETTSLTATSTLDTDVFAFATDETTVVDQAGAVVLVSDQSGIVSQGGGLFAYSHRVFNNTGSPDTFDLYAFPSEPGWTATIYNDSNGDGIYTPGFDVAIANSLLLADGADQLFFVVVDSPPGTSPGDTDVTSLTAISRNDTDLFDAVSDTTTVGAASSHDLSGGDTLLVSQGDDCIGPNDCPIFPGTLKSLQGASDRFDFTLTASLFFGLDGFLHPTQLVIDTDADGVPDLQIAEDSDGDGVWDTIAPGFDTNADLNPDVLVAGGGELAYELRRPVDPAQTSYRDPVTLSAISQTSGEIDSVTAVNLLAAPTHAMLSSFEVKTTDGKTVIEWQTSLEHATSGFSIRRRGIQGLERLQEGMIPAIGNAPAGASYRWVDETAALGATYTYAIEEIATNRSRRLLGLTRTTIGANPAEAGVHAPSGGFTFEERQPFSPRELETSPTPLVGHSTGSSNKGITPTQLRVLVSDPGIQFVSGSDLATAFGVTPAQIQGWIGSGDLQIDHGPTPPFAPCNPGPGPGSQIFTDGFESGDLCAWTSFSGDLSSSQVAWLAAPDLSGLYFHGRTIESIYTNDKAYWLRRGPGAQMTVANGGNSTAVSGQYFTDSPHFEEEGPYPLTSVALNPDGDFWFWNLVNVTPAAGVSIDTMTVTISSPAPRTTSANAFLTVALQAETEDSAIPLDHVAEIRLNGTLVGTTSWDGRTAHEVTKGFSQNLLNDGDNTVAIQATATSGINSEIFYLDALDLSYQRHYVASSDQLVALAGGHPSLTLEGFTRSDVTIFDTSSADRPGVVGNVNVGADGGGFNFSFETSGAASTYIALPLSEAKTPTLQVDLPSDLLASANRAEYLVIAGQGLEAASGALAAYRGTLGIEARTVRVQDIYDEFNRGIVSPWAIRDFLKYTQDHWQVAPRYLVLAGDSSFDFKDRLGFGGNLIPSPMTSTPDGLFPSDHRIVDLTGDDGIPEVAVGRLPVRDAGALNAYVNKLVSYENATGGWKSRTVWIADAADEGGEFRDDSEWLLARVPIDLSTNRIYVDDLGPVTARQQLLDAFDDGALLMHFLGHGNLVQMGDNTGLLLDSDIPNLSNGEKQPVLVAMTCALGRFDRIVLDTLSESLVLAEDGGVIALWAPTAFSFNEESILNSDAFLPVALDGTGRLGDAVKAGLVGYLETAEDPRAFIPYIYTLLGDPMVQLNP